MTSPILQRPAPRISCIICAFNEAPRIAAVLAAVSAHPLVDEVIVVDDGSTDGTGGVVATYPKVRLITSPTNCGKSSAMATGVAVARGELLMLLDADLKGLTPACITALVTPVTSGRADVSLSLRQNSLAIFRLLGIDFVSGERVVARDLLAGALEEIHRLPRFGIETFMNRRIIARGLRVAVADWGTVTQSRKTEKLGYWKGIRAEWRMIANLLQVTYPHLLLMQTYRLMAQRVDAKRLPEWSKGKRAPRYRTR